MDMLSQVAALVELAESLGLQVRPSPAGVESAEHPGGAMVRLKGKDVLFLDTDAPPADQLALLASSLAGRKELQDVFLPPELREVLDRHGAGQ